MWKGVVGVKPYFCAYNQKEMPAKPVDHLFLHYRSSVVHVLRMGNGPKKVLAFHGFSEEAAGFQALAPAFPDEYTLYAFDFPFHGQTDWQERHDLQKQDLEALIHQLGQEEGFSRYSLMGFSMGGRLCLAMVEHLLPQLDSLFLIAADGIQTHKVFNISIYPVWGRWVFKWIMTQPGAFFKLVGFLYRSKIISRFMYDFTRNHMDTPEKRNRIFHTWVALKNFVPDVPKVQRILTEQKIPVHLFFGQRDEVIPADVGRAFLASVPHATFDLVPKGHKLIHAVTIPYLQKYL